MTSYFYKKKRSFTEQKTTAKKVNLSTRFVETELYQMAMPDKFFPILLVITIAGLIYLAKKDLFQLKYLYFVAAIIICTVITYWVQYYRVREKKRFLKFNKKQIFLIAINLLILIIPTVIYRNNGGSWEKIFDQFLVSFWETGTFGISIVFALLLLFRFSRKNTFMETGFFALVLVLSTLAFTFAHVKVYGLDPFKLSFLFVFGLAFNFISYSINSSLGILLHYLNNILVYNKVLMVM